MCDEILTEFVRDRLKETPWRNREYISSLQRIERTLSRRGPKHFTEALVYGQAKSQYPVEHECIKLELEDGVYTTAAEFRGKVDEHEQAKRERDRKEQLARLLDDTAKEQAEHTRWLELGGRP